MMISRRLLAAVPTVLLLLLFAMLLVNLSPTDPAVVLAGEGASPEQLDAIRSRFGLDEPLLVRYHQFVTSAVRGDLGHSFRNGRPVWDLIAESIPVTASLAVLALVFTVVIAVPAGILAALYRDRFIDRGITTITSLFLAMPSFVVALILVVLFAINRDWFPATGYVTFARSPADWLRHLALPAFALALPSAAELSRQIRGSFIDTFEEPFVTAQYAKGLSRPRIIGKHVSKSASVPAVTVLGLQVGRVLGGAVVIEMVFALPGFGLLSLTAVMGRDFAVVQGVVVIGALIVIAVNLIVDLSYLYLAPQTRAANG
jgi:peptide/nickel transport system permease protein